MKKLLLVLSLISLFSCSKDEVSPKKMANPNSFDVHLTAENTSTSPKSKLVVELYTVNETGKKEYILRDTIQSNNWSYGLLLEKGQGKVYFGVWRTDFRGDNGGLKSSIVIPNGLRYDDYIDNPDNQGYMTNTTHTLSYESLESALQGQ